MTGCAAGMPPYELALSWDHVGSTSLWATGVEICRLLGKLVWVRAAGAIAGADGQIVEGRCG